MFLFVCGVLWRWYWIFYAHPATDYVFSDMRMYVDQGVRYSTGAYSGSISDTYFPPAMSLLIGFTYNGSWNLLFILQFIMSVCVPGLIFGIALELYDRRTAFVSLAIASVYFPFIDYAGFFLAENPFLFGMLLSSWLLLLSVRMNAAKWAIAIAVLSGVAAGFALEFKAQGVLPVLFVGAFLVYVARRFKWKRLALVLAASSAGIALVIVPFAIRNTRLTEGRLCIIASSGPLVFLVGHDPNVTKVECRDPVTGTFHIYWPPALSERNKKSEEVLPYGAYESDKIMALALERVSNNKFAALAMSFDHVYEMFFGVVPFPTSGTDFRRLMDVFQKLFTVFILFPAGFCLLRRRNEIAARTPVAFSEILLLLPILGICATVFLTIGETRFRVPFDAFFIILAARFYLSVRLPLESPPMGRWHSLAAR
jgi:4-amino-4-deoxy-L-arabinose transferase-like glycosyltransferase